MQNKRIGNFIKKIKLFKKRKKNKNQIISKVNLLLKLTFIKEEINLGRNLLTRLKTETRQFIIVCKSDEFNHIYILNYY